MANLYKDLKKKFEINNSIDSDLYEYIKSSKNNEYDEILKNDERWEIFYHLSSMREGILNWYEFKSNATLLEIGGEFGALTGLFCQKCAHVVTLEEAAIRAEAIAERCSEYTNLDIYETDIFNYTTEERFDYIVIVGGLEKLGQGNRNKTVYAEILKQIKKFLKVEGKIIFAVENRYGIRYFCGAPEPYSGIPFEGINNFPNGISKGYLFDKQEVCDILSLAEMDKYKFYYPFPDYKLPQLIYSDNYLEGVNIRERLIPYYMNKDTLIASEMDLYVDLMNNKVLPFFANSFLVEYIGDGSACFVNYATISGDRGEENGFVTTICEDNIVRKRALYDKGTVNLRKSAESISNLEERGINVIPHKMVGNILEMPYEQGMTCSNYLLSIVAEKPNEFIKIFDKLYECILDSSEQSFNSDFFDDVYGKRNWGHILKKAYIDMVPVNCFYKDGKLYFFDQEFSIENCPAKFVMFRAIKYTYIYIKLADKSIPIQKLKERYDITDDLWDVFEEIEKKFISGNRNKELYKNFYRWTGINRKRIQENGKKLLDRGVERVNEEKNAEKKMENGLVKVQRILFDLLDEFVRVCDKYNLQYYLFYGSLLGAVRNHGIIPWDDDIDLVMPRKDYNELLKVAEVEFEKPYFLQHPLSDDACFYGGYSKLRNSDTSAFEGAFGSYKGNQGVFIDIFPLDNVENNNELRRMRFDKIRKIQKLLFVQTYGLEIRQVKNMTEAEKKRYLLYAKIIPRKLLCKKLDALLQKRQMEDTDLCGILARYYEENQYRLLFKSSFANFKLIDFEGKRLKIPVGYEQCLKTLYGRSYMKLPPEEKRIPSHKCRYYADIPYSRFWSEDSYDSEKKIILYGKGATVDYFMKKYPKQYWPEFIVDDDDGMWGRNKEGILIYPPEKIRTIENDKMQLIICDEKFEEKIREIEEWGISNFYIMRRW